MRIKSIVLITGNPGKAEEFRALIDIDELTFFHQSLDIPEIQSMELEEIGYKKTQSAMKYQEKIAPYDAVLTDDTGIFCQGLNGLPGPFIKWFLDCLGASGFQDLLRDKQTETKAVCLLSLGLTASNRIIQFKGEVDGKLVPERGSFGFGWDGVFLPDGKEKTYGEMPLIEKNIISHRTLAVQKLRNWILEEK